MSLPILAIVIPAYNEEKTIQDVLKTLPKRIPGIGEIISIVVDDGSYDKTILRAKKKADYVIRHRVNLGVGAATMTGFEAAKKLNADICITIDADGQHNPRDIKKLIQPIINKKVDVVIGTRMHTTTSMPAYKILGNWLMNIITLVVFHQWTTDSQSGMRAVSRKGLEKIHLTASGYEICSELIGEIKRNRLKMCELPIETIYTTYSNKKGQNPLNAINILTRIITIRLSHLK